MTSSSLWWLPLVQSAIQALGVVLAALVGLALWRLQVGQEQRRSELREDAEKRRAEAGRAARVREILIALRVEIAIDIERLELTFDPDQVDLVRSQMLMRLADSRTDRDRRDMPQAPTAADHFVFEVVKTDLTILPRETIGAVVRYYRYAKFLDELAKAFANGMFEGLSDIRQGEAVDAFLKLGLETLKAAENAVAAIASSIAGSGPQPASTNVKRDE